MVTIPELWLPILLSAVLVFVASSIIHMFLGYHAADRAAVPDEDRVRKALREVAIPPGDYAIPQAGGMKELSDPAFIAKQEEGPVAFLTVLPTGPIRMGPMLAQWYALSLVVGVIVAYVTGRTLTPGAEYLEVFRLAGVVAFTAYVFGDWPQSIWFKRKWSTTFRNTLDGFAYALLTAGAFAWLWP